MAVATTVAAQAVAAAQVLVPLYSWNSSCWPELQQAATSNPTASFLAILNPNSGPTSDTSDPSMYCVPVLRQAVPNLTLVGYISTKYGERDAGEVVDEVNTYRKWATTNVSDGGVEGTAGIDGIFFDETPSFTDSTSGMDKYVTYSQTVRQLFGSSSTVVYNPGTYTNEKLYGYASYVVAYEDRYAGFASAQLPTSTSLQQKSAIMVHTLGTADLDSLVKELVPTYGAVFVTDTSIDEEDVYARFGNDWPEFVADVVSASGSS
ncbi:hypothetical protein JCM8097_000661 [Rhodosporidiobolus ruineniae]